MRDAAAGAFGLAILNSQGEVIHVKALAAELRRAARAQQFASGPPSDLWSGCSCCVHPVGMRRGGLPAVCEAVQIELNAGRETRLVELGAERFRRFAEQTAAMLLAAGRLAADEKCRWFLIALGGGDVPAEDAPPNPLQLPPVYCREGLRPDARATRVLQPALDYADDVPIYVAQTALEEAVEFCRQDRTVERAGVLLGYLHVDDVGAFVLSPHWAAAVDAPSNDRQLHLGPDAWQHIHQRMAALSGPDLACVAWAHSHVPLGDSGNTEHLQQLSLQDEAVHAAFWSEPHVAAIVLDPAADGLSGVAAWGWDRHGLEMHPRTIFLYDGGGTYGD